MPPSWSGQAVLIRRLLTGLDPRAYCLLTSDQGRYGSEHTEPLATRYHRLPAVKTRYASRDNKWLYGASALLGAATGILRRAVAITRAARRERCERIVAFTGDFHDLPAAFVASRVLRVPLYVYMCDYYSHRELYEPAWRRLSPSIERVVVRGAERVVCGTDTLADALAQRYGIAPAVIHHPADLTLYRDGVRAEPDAAELAIVYTGTIYDAQLDAVQNLLAALERPEAPAARLHVYSGQSEANLAARGLTGRIAIHPHLPAPEIAAAQLAAGVLLLPLAFASEYPEVIRTSAPMKFGEYLAAGGPILAHAPPGSFVAEYCRRHDCAVVVDEPDPARVAEAVAALARDPALRARLVANARERAATDFSIEVAHARFAEVLALEPMPEQVA